MTGCEATANPLGCREGLNLFVSSCTFCLLVGMRSKSAMRSRVNGFNFYKKKKTIKITFYYLTKRAYRQICKFLITLSYLFIRMLI